MKNSSENALEIRSASRVLRQRDIEFIENALRRVGAFGEVHLVVERGRIRFVRTIKSESVDEPKAQPSLIES